MAYKLVPEQPKPSQINADSIHRLPAQAIKGVAATLPGVAGDILSLPYAGVNKLVTALGGEDVPYEKSFLGKTIPTTQTHIQNLEEGIPYLKPRNKIESFVNDIASDATSIFIPGSTLTKSGLHGSSAFKSFATSLGANSAGSFVADITGDPQKGAYTKMGTMFFLSSLSKPWADKEVGKLYEKADKLLPESATINASRLEKEMEGLKSNILKGRSVRDLAPSEKFVVEESNKVLRQIEDGQANVGTLKSTLRSLNENLTKMIYESPDKSSKIRAKKLATHINRNINSTLADYGKSNPKWWQAQRGANEGFAAIQQSNFITNFVKQHAKSSGISESVLALFGKAAGVSVLPAYQTAKIAYKVYKSPALAKHYAKVVSSAAAEDVSAMNKHLHELEGELKKEEQKKPKYRLLD